MEGALNTMTGPIAAHPKYTLIAFVVMIIVIIWLIWRGYGEGLSNPTDFMRIIGRDDHGEKFAPKRKHIGSEHLATSGGGSVDCTGWTGPTVPSSDYAYLSQQAAQGPISETLSVVNPQFADHQLMMASSGH
jgi:hypothetical protein